MKKVLLISLVALLSACSTTYYQVYTIQSSDTEKTKANKYVYEDDNCLVMYNFWRDGGSPGFTFYNNTDSIIYVDLSKSFFVRNGIAYDYFLNRSWSFDERHSSSKSSAETQSKSTSHSAGIELDIYGVLRGYNYPAKVGISYGVNNSKGSSTYNSSTLELQSGRGVSVNESPIIPIPPKAFKSIDEYIINRGVIDDCNEKALYPKTSFSYTYLEKESPITFQNYITYKLSSGETKVVTNSFWVSGTTNCPEKEALVKLDKDGCGKALSNSIRVLKEGFAAPNKFYVVYTKKW